MSKTIMIAEDDQIFHDLYTEMLEDTAYRLIHVYDGEEALLEVEKEKPDLIILDIVMHLVTGDMFFLYLKSILGCEDIPVIIISSQPKRGYKNLRDVEPNLTFLDKTVTKEKLLEGITAKIG